MSLDVDISDDAFKFWCRAICTVTFDLEYGQSIEHVYPESVALSEAEKSCICYLAFPDSNSTSMGDTQFHFRYKSVETSGQNKSSTTVIEKYNERCATILRYDLENVFGYAYFRQVKDASNKRGYFQKSVIFLSHLPLVHFLSQVVSIIAKNYFHMSQGEVVLESCCAEMKSWNYPPLIEQPTIMPVLGVALELKIASSRFNTINFGLEQVSEIVCGQNEDDSKSSSFISPCLLLTPNLIQLDFYTIFKYFIDDLHLIWELVLTSQPIVVFGPTPEICSIAVQCLTQIINPLHYAADYRPYFTIHDPDFKEFTSSSSSCLPSNGIIIGATNPFLAKSFSHWPHIIQVEVLHHGFRGAVKKPSILSTSSSSNSSSSFLSSLDLSPRNSPSIRKIDKSSSHVPGLLSQYKSLLSKPKSLYKRLHKGLRFNRSDEVQSALIRRHFYDLSQSFMLPLERYWSSLMPLAKSYSPFRTAIPTLKTFDFEAFLSSLPSTGPQLTCDVKGDWHALYKSFFKSANFASWHSERMHQAHCRLQSVHLQLLAEADVKEWSVNKNEVQMIDLFLRIKSRLDDVSNSVIELSKHHIHRLELHLETLKVKLPSDLNGILRYDDQPQLNN